MAKQIQLRRGTTAENNAFKGALGELTYDTEKKQLRVHDGSTTGGKDVTSQVSNATETEAGKAKIATTSIAQAGVNDTDFITPLKLSGVIGNLTKNSENITSTMIVGTTYTNTLPYTIFIGINGAYINQSGVNSFYVGADEVWNMNWGFATSEHFYVLVPIGAGKTYRQASGTGTQKIMRYY